VNQFADLYAPRDCGTWMTPRQGLTDGMDLHDWKRFIVRAVLVIRQDTDVERRIRKAHRLQVKAQRVGAQWGGWYVQAMINRVVIDAEHEIAERADARLEQLSLWGTL
jgi:hypothetical protein